MAFGAADSQDDMDGFDEQDLSPEELREQLAAERALRQAAETAASRDQQRFDSFLREVRAPQDNRSNAANTVQPLGAPPDPSVDWEGHQRWLAEKDRRAQAELEARFAREREEITRTVTEQTTTATLWARFQTKYPTYASRSTLVRAAYVALIDAGRLPNDAEGAVDAVKREMDAMVGTPLDSIPVPANRTPDLSQPGAVRRRAARSNTDADAVHTTHETITAEKRKYGLI